MPQILLIDAGSVPYAAAYAWQRGLHRRLVAGEIGDVVLLVEHPHVYTLGRRFRPEHLLEDPGVLAGRGIEVWEADRGGSITYHGPGQVVAYPVVDLRRGDGLLPDLIGYLRLLEQAVIATVGEFGIRAGPRPGLTGVWVGTDKLAAVGVNVSRGVSRHGLALNVSTDLEFFSAMIPCGIPGAGVTSMERILGYALPVEAVGTILAGHLARLLGRSLVKGVPGDLGLTLTDQAYDLVSVAARAGAGV